MNSTETRPRPPSYVSRRTLADELDCAESTIDELVRRGILPRPVHLSSGRVRWCWDDVIASLAPLKSGSATETDPYLSGARNATRQEK
jgi:predicted DNA-binding transcriptional regulator AlpA